MDWQDAVVGGVVALAVTYVARQVRMTLAGKKGCCDKPCGGAVKESTLVQIQGMEKKQPTRF